MKHKGLLFDLDGVIVDTAKYHYIAWKEIAAELGISFSQKDNERLKGVSRDRSFEIILEIGGITMSKEEQEAYCTKKNEIYLSYIRKMQEDEILPGVREFLTSARREGYRLALGSASKNSQLILERLRLTDLFDEIIDGTKVSKAKPDPEVFQKGAEALGLSCEECVVFEDSVAGIEAAHAGGMQAVGIGSKELLPQAECHIQGFLDCTIAEVEDALLSSLTSVAMNPFLPLEEYIPDGEPRLWGERLYLYGSHDAAGGEKGFCPGDYVIWSCHQDRLGDWKLEGVGFAREDCPGLTSEDAMAAPDVVQGPDGRYYLYWNTNHQKCCHVAVSNRPEGPFSYYGPICLPDGTPYEMYKMFDPGVLVDDDQRVYLYAGFCMPGPVPEEFKNVPSPFAEYSLGFELEPDMRTIRQGPKELIPGGNRTKGTGFEGHGFYEASSPRKINGCYYMVYSSEQTHDLCYAVADKPLGSYRYGGILVSNADIGLWGNTTPKNPYGNTHGGLVQIKGQWYVFYHRQTHGIECCRQACAEPIEMDANGRFQQAEMTSCGLNGGPLPGKGCYQAAYACNLMGPSIGNTRLNVHDCVRDTQPHIYEQKLEDGHTCHYIANMQDATIAGFKFFRLGQADAINICLRGNAAGTMDVYLNEECTIQAASISFAASNDWQQYQAPFQASTGVYPLFFRFSGSGHVDWKEFTLL